MNEFWQLTILEQEAFWLSVKVAIWCVLISLPLGIIISLILVRFHFPGKILLEIVLHLPLVMPPVATGYLLLILFGKQGFIGSLLYQYLGITIVFSWRGAVLASIVVSFPLLVRAMKISLEAIDRKLEEAARTLGASTIKVFMTITLPLMIPGILSGVMFAFARSLGEFGATITFVSSIQGETMTLPLALYSLLQQPNTENATLRLLSLSIVLSVGALLISEALNQWITRRRTK